MKNLTTTFSFYLVFILFFLIYVRFNGLIFDAVSWDEAAYMTTGRDVANGLIPYKDFLELKPPLTFFLFSIPSVFFDDSFIAFRLYGYLFLYLSSIILFYIVSENHKLNLAVLFVFLFIGIMNYHFWLWNTSELITLPFILLSFLFLKQKSFFYSGLMISLATLIRINYCFTVIFIIFFLAYKIYRKEMKFIYLYRYILGGLIPLAIFIIYFYYHGALLDFKISNFDIFLAYSSENTFFSGIYNFFKAIFKLNYFYSYVFLPFSILLIFSLFGVKKDDYILRIYILSISLSIILSGHSYSHHFIQLIPFLIIFIAQTNFDWCNFTNRFKNFLLYTSILSTFFISSFSNYKFIKEGKSIKSYHLYNKILTVIPAIDSNTKILALDYQIITWKYKSPRMSKITHTPSLFKKTTKTRIKPYVRNGIFDENYLDHLLNAKPEIIICSVRICEESRKSYEVEKISKLLIGYKEIYREPNVSKWEYTKTGTIIIYKSVN